MSRVAKKPVALPKGVECTVANDEISVKGPKGTLKMGSLAGVDVESAGFRGPVASRRIPARIKMAGTARALLANMVHGVSDGFERKLELVGVGYRATLQGKDLNLTLGFSHPVVFKAPEGITIAVPTQTEVTDRGRRQAARRRSRRENSRVPSTGAVQGQGCALRGRADHAEGSQEG